MNIQCTRKNMKIIFPVVLFKKNTGLSVEYMINQVPVLNILPSPTTKMLWLSLIFIMIQHLFSNTE